MTNLQQWAILYGAYNQVGSGKVLKDVFWTKGNTVLKIILWGIIGILIVWGFISPWVFNSLKISYKILELLIFCLPFISLPFFINWTVKNTYKSFYKNEYYFKFIKAHGKGQEAIRYLLFKINLETEKINHEQIQILKPFIEKELELIRVSILARHPLIISLVGIITAVAGGAASIKEGWTSYITPLILIILIYVLWFGVQVIEVFKGKEYKLHELNKFIFWLEQEK